ncbi:hypothetical protein STRDD13_01467 [Streptococcus sp. DD13]|nr:hypothetical protein STRDD13_01467 [Streptococcus sp. DD13]
MTVVLILEGFFFFVNQVCPLLYGNKGNVQDEKFICLTIS